MALCCSAPAALPVNFFSQRRRPCYLQAHHCHALPSGLSLENTGVLWLVQCVFPCPPPSLTLFVGLRCVLAFQIGKTIWYPGFVEDSLLMGCGQVAAWYLQQFWEPFNALPLPRWAALYLAGMQAFSLFPANPKYNLCRACDTSHPTGDSLPFHSGDRRGSREY